MTRRPVYIVWHDAHAGTETWVDLHTHKDVDPYVVRSTGWLLTDDLGGKPGHISIAQSWSDDDAVDSILHIPLAMVQEIVYLKGKRRADKRTNRKDRKLPDPSSSQGL
jgi:hypothetical protein